MPYWISLVRALCAGSAGPQSVRLVPGQTRCRPRVVRGEPVGPTGCISLVVGAIEKQCGVSVVVAHLVGLGMCSAVVDLDLDTLTGYRVVEPPSITPVFELRSTAAAAGTARATCR